MQVYVRVKGPVATDEGVFRIAEDKKQVGIIFYRLVIVTKSLKVGFLGSSQVN